MKDLLRKKFYCYNFHTSLAESSAISPSIGNPPIWITCRFLQENLDSLSMIFQKSHPATHINKMWGVHTILNSYFFHA